jgi:hypothetical protein
VSGASGVVEIVIGVAVVAWVLVRQLLPRRVSWRMMLVFPAVLAYFAWKSLPAGAIPARQGVELALELVLALACGLWQASVTRVWRQGSQWMMRGGPLYLAGWVVFIGGDIGLRLAIEGPSALTSAPGHGSTWIAIVGGAACWLVRAAVLALRHPETLSAGPAPS